MFPVELRTDRLLLREETLDDAAFLFQLASNKEAAKYQTWDVDGGIEKFNSVYVEFLAQREKSPRECFEFIVEIDSKRAGFCGLTIESHKFRRAALSYGYMPEFWGNGIGTEAARRVMQFGFAELDLVRLQITSHPDNIGSLRIAERIGMTYEGRLHKYALGNGEWRDSLLYARVSDTPNS